MADQGRDKVQLGCGTLILIALIVLFFSGPHQTEDMGPMLRDLRDEIQVLEKKVDALTTAVNRLQAPDAATDSPMEEPAEQGAPDSPDSP